MRQRACLHGGGGHQVGEVTCDRSPHLSCKRNQVKMRDYMDRRVTPPKRVTSPTWSPPPPCQQALIVLKMKRVSVNNSSEGEGYTSEIWRSTLESNGLLAQSQREVTQTDAIANSYRRSLVGSLLLFFISDFSTGEFGLSKSLLEIFIVISGETMCRLIVAVTFVLPVSVM